VAIHGQGFASQAVTEDISAAYPVADPGLFHIGFLHTSLDGREGHAPYAPTSSQVLAQKGYDYWALGHVHKREIVSGEGKPMDLYPGAVTAADAVVDRLRSEADRAAELAQDMDERARLGEEIKATDVDSQHREKDCRPIARYGSKRR